MTQDNPSKEESSQKAQSLDNGFTELQVDYSPEDERKLVKKIDRVILPLMCLCQFFQYLDKQAIGYAAVFDLADHLGMTHHQYSWSVSSFYCGQFVSEYIFIYLMSRLPIVRFVGVSIIIWGIVAGCLAAPNSFIPFTAVRTLLGFTEGAITPAFVIITGMWYKKSEHPIRTGAWITANGLAQILGALAMYGVGTAHGSVIESWRVMFLVCGGGTILAGACFIALMPTSPATAWFLTPQERDIAVKRLASERLSKESTKFKMSQVWEFVKDHRAMLLVLAGFLNTLASPVIKFATLVIKGFGWSDLNTMLVSLPAGVIQIITIWIVVLGPRYTRIPRCAWGVISSVPALIGNIGVATLPQSNKWGVVVFTWFATILSPNMVIVLSLIASNIKGNTKKSAASNGYFMLYAAAAIAGPQLWTKPPRYTSGIITDMVCLGTNMCVFGLFWLSGTRENHRRDQMTDPAAHSMAAGDADMTDREDLSFRYTV